MKSKSYVASLVAKWLILIVVLTAIYLPLLMIIIYSFSSAQSIGGEYGDFSFALYGQLLKNKTMLDATRNTLIIGLVSASLATVLGTTAAVGIHYMRRRARAFTEASSQITIVNAEIVTAMGFFLLMIFLRDILYWMSCIFVFKTQ